MFSIRPYQSEDENRLIHLWYESWHSNDPQVRHPDPVDQWARRWYEEIVPSHEIAVAEEGGKLLGFCAIDVPQRYLSQLFVHPDNQGKGAGSTLLDWAKSVCPEGFTLHNLTRNSHSRRFYEHQGLKPGRVGLDPLSEMENIEYTWAKS